jgi:hypothetical protein
VLYDTGVDYDDFQDAVLDLAAGGTRLTKGAVALRLKIEPARAGAMLDRMTGDGRLELDVDERSGEIFYVVARRPNAPIQRADQGALAEIGKAIEGGALAAKVGAAVTMAKMGASVGGPLAPDKQRKVALGVLLGGLLPGFGLVYSAPWPVAIAGSIVVFAGIKIIGLIPFFSTLLLVPFLVVCVLASAILGGLYTWQYNQTGKRTPLGDEGSPQKMLKRLRKKPG